jgi:hypothetical protein
MLNYSHSTFQVARSLQARRRDPPSSRPLRVSDLRKLRRVVLSREFLRNQALGDVALDQFDWAFSRIAPASAAANTHGDGLALAELTGSDVLQPDDLAITFDL